MFSFAQLVRALPIVLMAVSMPNFADDARSGGPVFSATGPDALAYGASLGYPVGLPFGQQSRMVGNYSHYDSLYPSHLVAKAQIPSPLSRAPNELPVSYQYNGQTLSIQDYLAHNPTTGLLIAKDNTILFEHYQYGRTDQQRFMSESMAKTIVAMLVGIAMSEHKIRSLDDTVQTYVPELQHTEMGIVPIRALLHMASGIAYTQDYSASDDNTKFHHMVLSRTGPGPIAAVASFDKRIAAPDTVFSYASLDTEALGLVLTHVTGVSVSEYLQTRIWQPMGAEADARWVVDNTGQEVASCCFNASLRDYARLGLMLAHDGAFNGKQIVPRQWVLDATRPAVPGSFLAFGKSDHPGGYGYQVWLLPGQRRMFALEGVHGQRILIDPKSGIVLVHTAVRPQAAGSPGETELRALWRGLIKQYGEPSPA